MCDPTRKELEEAAKSTMSIYDVKVGDFVNFYFTEDGQPHKVRVKSKPRRIAGGTSIRVEVVNTEDWPSTATSWDAAACNLRTIS